ncbi:hypothetical protein MN608_06849 [Microdochium nivale]|nr:hypothetical protein MN608_06849 [Microdochium nivale]
MGRPEEAGAAADDKNPFFHNGGGGAAPDGGETYGAGMTSVQPYHHSQPGINRHAYASRSAPGDDFGNYDDDLPPGYTPAVASSNINDTGSLPPAYGADSNVAGANAVSDVEPLALVISGHYVYGDTADPKAGLHGPPSPSSPPLPVASAGPALYAMNRGIASLSHTDSSVTFDRLDHSVRQNGSSAGGAGDGSAAVPRIVQRSRHIFDLRHVTDQSANIHVSPFRNSKSRIEGAVADASNIPFFYCQATSRRSLGSFGLQQIKVRGSGLGAALKGASEQGYDVVPLARRKGEHETPQFAFGEKGAGLARPIFTARLRPVDGGGGGSGSSSSGVSSRFGKGKEKADPAPHFWEWHDELGRVVAHEDTAWRGVLPDTRVPGQDLPQVDASGIPQPRPCHRLVTTTGLAREAFDVLVSSWCLRVWWESADAHAEPGASKSSELGRSLKYSLTYWRSSQT